MQEPSKIITMKNRLLQNWTISRAVFLIMGSVIAVEFVLEGQWLGAMVGIYFASMGLFAFGCAAGNCMGRSCMVDPNSEPETKSPEAKSNN